MDRKSFLIQTAILAGSLHVKKSNLFIDDNVAGADLYAIFKNPGTIYQPYVRWWWNGDKVERSELSRELRLLKEAGIGGVEINPIKFPARTDDLGKHSAQWLSDEWIDLLQFTLDEAKSLGLVCDLIVGSGWPFGAEWLEDEERSQVIVIGAKKLEGPLDYEVSLFDLFKTADPAISSPFPGRTMEMLSVQLTPALINKIEEVTDLSNQIANGTIRVKIPEGKFVLYALVKINAFAQVIQGAPGATGPVLNHYNETAVRKYLHKMSDKVGFLSSRIRSFFSDSLELEGANWCTDMQSEFQKRRGYDLMPWLPFILFKLENLGNTWVYDYGAEYGTDFKEMINRIRYDFESTKAELLEERFVHSFIQWCKENNVKSRMQGYGRGYFPLEGTFNADIPECETWIRTQDLGVDMSETDYRIGRAYTMINKYVSSAAHLKGKRHISCEELTNTDLVFNETLELMKIAGDQSIISGVTHPIFHGFNYSPPETPFPGWVIYGTFINERNPWWPYFKYFTTYKTRLSAILQQATMFADIAVLPATADTWSKYSAQNEPFPIEMYPPWQTLVWESIHQNGNACDYVSENVIQHSTIQNGALQYGDRKYHTVFLTQVESMEPATAKKLFDFVSDGGRIFFIEMYPTKSPGWKDHEAKDAAVQEWINKIKSYADRSRLLSKPEKNFMNWFGTVQEQYQLDPYVKIDKPNKFVTQVRYQAKDFEMLVFINSNMNESYGLTVTPSANIMSGKQAWIWDPETGERYRLNSNRIDIGMGPADLKLVVFDKQKKGQTYNPKKTNSPDAKEIRSTWSVVGKHIDGRILETDLNGLKDLKEIPEWANFCGTIIYRNNFIVDPVHKIEWMNIGKVFGVSELSINGVNAGMRWYGHRIYSIDEFIKEGNNEVEIKVVTTMGNYMKSLTNNKIAQYWTNEGRKLQPLKSIGLLGPVIIY